VRWWCWQELGAEVPRDEVKEGLESVWEGAKRGKSVGQQQTRLEPEERLEGCRDRLVKRKVTVETTLKQPE
jgi:hypothetical protein